MSWHTSRMAGFDLETTGTNPEQDRIVTACIVQVGGNEDPDGGIWIADPGIEIPAEASAVHGITTAQAQAEGRPAADVVDELVGTLAALAADGMPIVAMNAAFDLTMLDREARRHGITPLVDLVGDQLRVIDPRVLDKKIDRYRSGKRTLSDLCAHYGVRLDGAHSADADAVAACRVAWRIAQREPVIADADLAFLHDKQTEWAAEQAAGLAAYFAHTPGKEHLADGVRGEWPLIPFTATEVAS